MPLLPTIRHLSSAQIDTRLWDASISQASHPSPYALSEYLNTLCPNWEALIAGDYEFVMPLPVRKKWGIKYLYQPFLVPHLGVYGRSLNTDTITHFLRSIPPHIRWIDITLNPGSIFSDDRFELRKRTNYILPLNQSYHIIHSGYRENHKRNLQRAEKNRFTIDRDIEPHEILALAQEYLGPRGHFPMEHKDRLVGLLSAWIKKGLAHTYGIRHAQKLMASAIFLKYANRYYYLIAGNHPDGKTLGASHTLIDAFIREHAEEDRVLDFEGSDTPSLAFFYEGFGSEKESYGWLQINRLPWWLAWIKSGRQKV